MKTPSKNSFKLSKVKLVKDGGLDCQYEVEEIVGSEVYHNKYNSVSARLEHPDLSKCFKELKPVIARIYHLTFFRTLMETEEFKASGKQMRLADDAYNELLEKIDVTGISLSGEDDNVGVVVTGTFLADSEQKMAINTHRIRLEDDRYGFELEMEETVNRIESEVYAYLFEDKQAQLQLFTANGEPSEVTKESFFPVENDNSAGEEF